jgi:hypothetical protein
MVVYVGVGDDFGDVLQGVDAGDIAVELEG